MSVPTFEPFLQINLAREVEALQASESATGRNAKVLVKYDDLRVVLTTLKAGARMAEHKTEGRISIQGITGRLRLRVGGQTFEVTPGTLLALDKDIPHDVEAVGEDSAFLLTIAWPRR